jgi:hypothetical protein
MPSVSRHRKLDQRSDTKSEPPVSEGEPLPAALAAGHGSPLQAG